MKEIQIPLYPRKLWLIDDVEDLDQFTFVIGGGNAKECSNSREFIKDNIDWFKLLTHAAIKDDNGDYGVVVVYNMDAEVETGDVAHEAVHVTDYVFDELNMAAQSYENGNEPYAYLLGWVAKQLKDYYDDRRK